MIAEVPTSFIKRGVEGSAGEIVYGFDVVIDCRCVVVCERVVVCLYIPSGDALALSLDECELIEAFSASAAQVLPASTLPSTATGKVDIMQFVKENTSQMAAKREHLVSEFQNRNIQGIESR